MRKAFFINILLAFCWTAVTGQLTVVNLLIGFAIGILIMFILRPLLGPTRYTRRLWHIVVLAGLFLWDLVGASLQVAADSLRLRHSMRSGVIAVNLDVETDTEITVLAGLISLMPGTLALDVSEDRETMFIHVMHIPGEDVEAYEEAIKRKLELRVRRAFGPG